MINPTEPTPLEPAPQPASRTDLTDTAPFNLIDLEIAWVQSPAGERRASLETQNALYRSILSAYRNGLADQGALAAFALDCPDQATKALEAYQAQQQRVIDAAVNFLQSPLDDLQGFEREMDTLLRMRGAGSRSASGVVDARGSRRRRR